MLNELKAKMLLDQCVGDEIWSVEVCREAGVPDAWIDELADAIESGFQSDRQTIYLEGKLVNQYHGVEDLRLAYKLAEYLGVDVPSTIALVIGRLAEVRALKEAVEEL
jgi:hypothetical protein